MGGCSPSGYIGDAYDCSAITSYCYDKNISFWNTSVMHWCYGYYRLIILVIVLVLGNSFR